jgi:hypothetical protein
MKPDSFWKLELMENTGKKLSLALKFLIPLVLVIPVAIPSIPPAVKAGGFTLAIAFVGIFGTAVGLSRLREQHLTGRLSLLPLSQKTMVLEYLGVNALFTGLQFLIPLISFMIIVPQATGNIPSVVIGYCSVIVVSSGIGVLISGIARSSGEGHLIAILAIFAIIGVSGIFIPWGSRAGTGIATFLPYGELSSVLQGMVAAPGDPLSALSVLASAIVVLLAVVLFARTILRDR